MFDLVQVGQNTWYVDNPVKIGVYRTGENEVWFIDSGNDKDCARKLANKVLAPMGWTLKGIAVTHSNADHVGGCAELKKRTGCVVAAVGVEKAVTENPLLEPALLYGGYPLKELKSKFLMAPPCPVDGGWELLPQGLEPIALRGHFFDMHGFRTDDGVVFLADSVFGVETIEKYHLSLVTEPRAFLQTLDDIDTMEAELFVPSHAPAAKDISPLAEVNRRKTLEILDMLEQNCQEGLTIDELIAATFTHYGLTPSLEQYALIGTTIRSYLAYLCEEGRLETFFEENHLRFRKASL